MIDNSQFQGFRRALTCVLLVTGTSFAQADLVWEGSVSSAFSNPDNWRDDFGETSTTAPGPGDVVRFNGGNPIVTFGGNASAERTQVSGGFDFQLNFNTYTTSTTITSSADLSIFDGTISGSLHAVSSSGRLTLENTDAALIATDNLTVQDTGRITVLGGTVASEGSVVVRETGRLFVDGGTLDTGTLIIGDGSFGSARVTLRDTQFIVGTEIIISQDASGTLDLANGTQISLDASQLTLGASGAPGVSADINIENGGQLTLSGPVAWGQNVFSRVDIDDGGILNVDSLQLGIMTSAGIDVRGDTSQLNISAGTVEVGVNDNVSADFTIADGAIVDLPGSLVIGVDGNGDLRTDDGALSVAGDLIFAAGASSNGDWSIDAGDSLLVDVNGDIIVGGMGDAEIEAEAENATILGANLIVGDQGTGVGFFDEFSDSVLDIAGSSIIGNEARGGLNINNGEWITGGDVTVGNHAEGQASLSSTIVSSQNLTIGFDTPAQNFVEMYGGEWTNDDTLIAGDNGVGELTAYDGTRIASAFTDIGVGNAGDGAIFLSGSGTELRTDALRVGVEGIGALTIEFGAQTFADSVDVAQNSLSEGAVVVSGGDSLLEVLNGIVLDGKGQSSLRVEDGATVLAEFATIDFGGAAPVFNAIVTGPGSKWLVDRLRIGTDSVNGGLLIEQGGMFECGTECLIGPLTGFEGVARVTDDGSLWHVLDDLNIGKDPALLAGAGGTGRVEVLDDGLLDVAGSTIIHNDGLFTQGSFLLDGGTVVTRSFFNDGPFDFRDGLLDVHDGVFDNGTPSFTVDGFEADDDPIMRLRDGASSIGFTDIVTIGKSHKGTAEILSGAQLTSRGGTLGSEASATGEASVNGLGSLWDAGPEALTVGLFGKAMLTIGEKAQVHSAGGFIAAEADSEGTVSIEGFESFWTSTLNINVAGNGVFSGGAGTLTLVDNASVIAPQVTVFFPGQLGGNGKVVGDVENFGEVTPGLSPGKLEVDGNYFQRESGELIIELGGLLAETGFDFLEITGEAALDGTVVVRLVNNFKPVLGNTFRFLTASLVDGTFSDELLPSFDGLMLDVVYGNDFVELSTVSAPVPLPASLWLLLPGIALVLSRRRI